MIIEKGDLVEIIKDKIVKDGTIICTTGSRFIVNDLRIFSCKCPSNNKHTYVWLGVHNIKSISFSCGKCNNILITDNKMWVHSNYYHKLDPNKEFATKYRLQIELMRSLIDKSVTPEAYYKLIGMTDGDDELLELGKQIITKISLNEL